MEGIPHGILECEPEDPPENQALAFWDPSCAQPWKGHSQFHIFLVAASRRRTRNHLGGFGEQERELREGRVLFVTHGRCSLHFCCLMEQMVLPAQHSCHTIFPGVLERMRDLGWGGAACPHEGARLQKGSYRQCPLWTLCTAQVELKGQFMCT